MSIMTCKAVGVARVATLSFALAVPSAFAAASATGFSGDLVFEHAGSTAYSARSSLNATSGVQAIEGDTFAAITFSPNLSFTNFNRMGTVSGSMYLSSATNLAPAGGWAPDATITISGTYNISGASVYFGGFNPFGPNDLRSGRGSFAWQVKVSDMLDGFARAPAYGYNLFNYAGPGASVGSGSATFTIASIVASQGVSAVPEASTLSLMALGLLGLGAARRRQQRV